MDLQDESNCEAIAYNENDFTQILELLNPNGLYFLRSKLFMFLIISTAAMHLGAPAFINYIPKYECQLPNQIRDRITKKCNLTSSDWISVWNQSFPNDEINSSRCKRYSDEYLVDRNCSTYWSSVYVPPHQANNSVECTSWTYDTSVFKSSITTTFNLTCDDEWMNSLSKYAMLLGVFFGAFIAGYTSDKYGRQPVFISMVSTTAVASLLSIVVPSYYFYLVMRFAVGFGVIGACATGYVYTMEVTVLQQRILVGQIMQTTFSVGFMVLPLLAYFERSWKSLMAILSLMLATFSVPYFCLSGESPRWLLSKGEINKTKKILIEINKVNKRQVDFTNIKLVPIHKSSEQTTEISDSLLNSTDDKCGDENINHDDTSPPEPRTRDIFTRRILRNITLILMFVWFASTCIYYGLTLNITHQLSGDPFLNFFLDGFVEIPANLGAVYFMHRWGRRPVVAAAYLLSGISLVSLLFVPDDYISTSLVLYLIAKFGTSATFSSIYLYTSEIYPTLLRGNGIGICSSCARIGGVFSVTVDNLAYIKKSLPYVIYGVVALIAALLILLLPETNGSNLPDSIEDSEYLYKTRRLQWFGRRTKATRTST